MVGQKYFKTSSTPVLNWTLKQSQTCHSQCRNLKLKNTKRYVPTYTVCTTCTTGPTVCVFILKWSSVHSFQEKVCEVQTKIYLHSCVKSHLKQRTGSEAATVIGCLSPESHLYSVVNWAVPGSSACPYCCPPAERHSDLQSARLSTANGPSF